MVEFALLLPLAVGLTLGVVTGGTAYFRKVAIVDASREGARYGATLLADNTTAGISAWEDNVRSRVVQASTGELSSPDVCVKLVYPTGASDCGVADPAGASSEPTVRLVKVSAAKGATVEFVFANVSTTLTGRVAARYERDTG